MRRAWHSVAHHGGRVHYHLLRMPPTLLARHLLYKARRNLSISRRSGIESVTSGLFTWRQ